MYTYTTYVCVNERVNDGGIAWCDQPVGRQTDRQTDRRQKSTQARPPFSPTTHHHHSQNKPFSRHRMHLVLVSRQQRVYVCVYAAQHSTRQDSIRAIHSDRSFIHSSISPRRMNAGRREAGREKHQTQTSPHQTETNTDRRRHMTPRSHRQTEAAKQAGSEARKLQLHTHAPQDSRPSSACCQSVSHFGPSYETNPIGSLTHSLDRPFHSLLSPLSSLLNSSHN